MKTNILFVTIAMLMFACQSKKESNTIDKSNCDIITPELNMSESSENCMPAPSVKETTKFSPPVIKEDAIEENTSSQNVKKSGSKHKKIIKDGSIDIKVKTIEDAKKRMDTMLKVYNAYYENENFLNIDTRISYNLKIRVPSKQFEAFLKSSENGLGEITHKNIRARDVTEDYMDVEIRLNSKRLVRSRYNQLLEKAFKIDDILAIEENIRVLQEEIESQEGHLKFIDDQVNYSTLEINLFSDKAIPKPPLSEDTFFQRLAKSISIGWSSFVNFTLWVFAQWPMVIIIFTIMFIVKIYIKRRKENEKI